MNYLLNYVWFTCCYTNMLVVMMLILYLALIELRPPFFRLCDRPDKVAMIIVCLLVNNPHIGWMPIVLLIFVSKSTLCLV